MPPESGVVRPKAAEFFGNSESSNPSNTPEPFHGPRFRFTTIRGNVDAVHRLLTNERKITHLRAIIGYAMGAQQAFQWAVSHPDFANRIVATSITSKTYGHGVARLEGEIVALTAGATLSNGDYAAPPAKAIRAFGAVWLGGSTRRSGDAVNFGRVRWLPARRPGSTVMLSVRFVRSKFPL